MLTRTPGRRIHTAAAAAVPTGTLQGVETLAGADVPDADGGVCVPADQQVVPQLHAAGQRLVTRQLVDTPTCVGGA